MLCHTEYNLSCLSVFKCRDLFLCPQTSNDGNTTTSTLSLVVRKDDAGKYLTCQAKNTIYQKEGLEDGWQLEVQCEYTFNPLNPELNPICYLLALLAHHFLHVSRIRVKSLTLRLLMSYIYIYIYMKHLFLMFLDHTQRRSTVGRTPLDE